MKSTRSILALVLMLVALASCQKSGVSTTYSEKTGWKYNDEKRGFYNVQTEYDGRIPTGTVYISTNTAVKGLNGDPVSTQSDALKRRVGIGGYYMDEYEVNNIDWREYVRWITLVYAHEPRRILMAMPDETVWREELAYNEPLVQSYFINVAFGHYPVVGVSWKQANEYCAWRTDRANELILIDKKIIDFTDLATVNENIQGDPENPYAYAFYTPYKATYMRANVGDDYPDLDGIIYDCPFRLPTEAEWEFAAYGNYVEKQNAPEGMTYPWEGAQLREMYDKKKKGQFLANFMRGSGDPIGMSGELGAPTVPVDYFYPNSFGLYNMAGNVNEWVLDVYRATSNRIVNEINPFRGNQYESDSAYAETLLERLPYMEQDVRDSMRNVLINEKKFKLSGKDVRNFMDGDLQTALADSILVVEYASPIEQANMISDEARVYKGGSWKDRAIWMNPAKRRWLNQNKSSNDIGFRCVMSAVGGVAKAK